MLNQSSNPSIGVLQSFILADYIYVDAMTGKKIIAGTFTRLLAPEFPTEFSRITFAYLCLSGLRGKHKLKIRFIDLSDDSVLMESSNLEFENSDPLQSCEHIIEVHPFPMPHPGWFEFVAFCDENHIGRIRMELAKQ